MIIVQILMTNIIALSRDYCRLNSLNLDNSKSSHTVEHFSKQFVHVLTKLQAGQILKVQSRQTYQEMALLSFVFEPFIFDVWFFMKKEKKKVDPVTLYIYICH